MLTPKTQYIHTVLATQDAPNTPRRPSEVVVTRFSIPGSIGVISTGHDPIPYTTNIAEVAATLGVAGSTPTSFRFLHNRIPASGTFTFNQNAVRIRVPYALALAFDDELAVQITAAGADARDLVVQVRR